MIIREKYLAQIRGFYDSDLIKIITGVRRCGKSIILEQVMAEIKKKSQNVVYLDFDDRAVTSQIQTWQDIVKWVTEHRKKSLCYVFLDEVQEIDGWQIACRSLRRENCSVFITGSNSKLLSKEFTKELSGRYVSFRIFPFIYRELKEYAEKLKYKISIMDYLIWGGFPKRIEFENIDEQRRYLNDLDQTIIINDIINRYKIRKIQEFKKFVDYILISNARIYSANSISSFMKSNGFLVGVSTIQKWIGFLDEAYVISLIPRYSKKAKRKLEKSHKIYNCDPFLNSIRCTNNRFDLTHNLENVVYNELIYLGYQVLVYDNRGREIDFLAQKDGKSTYVQVAYSVMEEKAYQREFSAFNSLSQIDRKVLITNDELDYSTSNVTHIPLSKFLLEGL